MTTCEAITAAENAVKEALETRPDKLASRNLECALAHIREAWIAEDGQNARSIEKLQADVLAGLRFFDKAEAAKPGDVIELDGTKWKVQSI